MHSAGLSATPVLSGQTRGLSSAAAIPAECEAARSTGQHEVNPNRGNPLHASSAVAEIYHPLCDPRPSGRSTAEREDYPWPHRCVTTAQREFDHPARRSEGIMMPSLRRDESGGDRQVCSPPSLRSTAEVCRRPHNALEDALTFVYSRLLPQSPTGPRCVVAIPW